MPLPFIFANENYTLSSSCTTWNSEAFLFYLPILMVLMSVIPLILCGRFNSMRRGSHFAHGTSVKNRGCAQCKRNKLKHGKGVHFVSNSCPSPLKKNNRPAGVLFFFYEEIWKGFEPATSPACEQRVAGGESLLLGCNEK